AAERLAGRGVMIARRCVGDDVPQRRAGDRVIAFLLLAAPQLGKRFLDRRYVDADVALQGYGAHDRCRVPVASCRQRAKLLSRMHEPLTRPSATLSPLARGEGLSTR